jgi:two-component system sensor kinase
MWVPEGHHAIRADGELFPIEASLSRAEVGGRTIHTLILRDLEERNKERLREMSARMQHDIEEERKRISQALHDEMGQNLTALQLDADWIRRHCQGLPPVVDAIDRIKRCIEDSAASMRRIIADMRPRVLDDLGIDVAIRGLVKDLSTRTGLRVGFTSEGRLDDIDDTMKTALYRMLQECLTNVTRHAEASAVDVLLLATDRDIQMIVSDDGRGFSPQAHFKPGSFGLFGLGERAGQLGGTVAVESEPSKGTRIVVRLPSGAHEVDRQRSSTAAG